MDFQSVRKCEISYLNTHLCQCRERTRTLPLSNGLGIINIDNHLLDIETSKFNQ